MIQLTLTLKMTTAQVIETSVTVNNNSSPTIKLNLLLKWLRLGSKLSQFNIIMMTPRTNKRNEVKLKQNFYKKPLFSLDVGLLRQRYFISMDSNRMVKSAYVALHVQRCPRLFHLLLVVMHWGRRRRLNGSSKSCFLTDERLATLFITFCEKSGFISEVQFLCKILKRVFRRPKRFRDISSKAGLPTLSNTKMSLDDYGLLTI